MAEITSNGTGGGLWSLGASWAGSVAPVDNDSVVITSGDAITMDTDTSQYANGIAGVTIVSTSGETPGKLQFINGYDGFLKIKSGTNIVGTSGTVFGQLVANSDGNLATTTELQVSNSGVILFDGTTANGKLDCKYLDVNMRSAPPDNLYVQTYQTEYGPVDQSTAIVHMGSGMIDWGVAPPAANTAVRVKSTGVLPSGLTEDCIYYVYNITDTTQCQLARCSNYAVTVVSFGDAGTGNISMYNGHTNTATKGIRTLQDVSSDVQWKPTAKVFLFNIGPAACDRQADRLANVDASGVFFGWNNVDSAQYPWAEIWLVERNVEIRSNTTATTLTTIDNAHSNCYFGCALVATYNFTTSKTTYKADCFVNSTGARLNGPLVGFYNGYKNSTGGTIETSGIIMGTGYGLYDAYNIIIQGTLGGIASALYRAANCVYTSTSQSKGNTRAIASYSRNNRIDGKVIGCQYGVQEGNSNIVNGSIRSCLYGTYSSSYFDLNSTAIMEGCTLGIYGGDIVTINGEIRGCVDAVFSDATGDFSIGANSGFYYGRGGAIRDCNTGFTEFGQGRFASFSMSNVNTEMTGYLYDPVYGGYGHPRMSTIIQNYNQDGYLAVWNGGGKTLSEAYEVGTHGTPAVTPPTCVHHTTTENTASTSSLVKHFVELPLSQAKDSNLTINVYAKQVTTGFDELATFALVDTNDNILASGIMTDNTNWQSFELATPTAAVDGPVYFRMDTRGQSKELYWFTTATYGTGSSPPASSVVVGILALQYV